jgi:hypothetical protein
MQLEQKAAAGSNNQVPGVTTGVNRRGHSNLETEVEPRRAGSRPVRGRGPS